MKSLLPGNEKAGRRATGLWIWVLLAFIVLIAAWTVLILIAARNQPEILEIEAP